MGEMLERVARAICRRIGRHTYPTATEAELDEMVDTSWKERHWVESARAVIAAMREPTDDMSTAGMVRLGVLRQGEQAQRQHSDSIWRAMIDAALADDKEVPR